MGIIIVPRECDVSKYCAPMGLEEHWGVNIVPCGVSCDVAMYCAPMGQGEHWAS